MAEELGRLLSEHPTDNRRRRRIALVALGLGVLGLAVGIPLNLWYFLTPWGPAAEDPRYWSGSGMLESGLIVLGVFGLIVGAVLLSRASRSKDERFDLYENGIVHRLGATVSAIPWADIASAEQQGIKKVSAIPRLPGVEYRCVLRLRDGRRLGFGTYTTDAFALADRIEAAVRSTATTSGFPQPPDGV